MGGGFGASSAPARAPPGREAREEGRRPGASHARPHEEHERRRQPPSAVMTRARPGPRRTALHRHPAHCLRRGRHRGGAGTGRPAGPLRCRTSRRGVLRLHERRPAALSRARPLAGRLRARGAMDELGREAGDGPLALPDAEDPAPVRPRASAASAQEAAGSGRGRARATATPDQPRHRRRPGIWYIVGDTGTHAIVRVHRDGSVEVELGGTGPRHRLPHHDRDRRGRGAGPAPRDVPSALGDTGAQGPGSGGRRRRPRLLRRCVRAANKAKLALPERSRASRSARRMRERGDAKKFARPSEQDWLERGVARMPRGHRGTADGPRTTRPRRRTRARSSPRWRWTPRPATCGSSGSSRSTTAASRSTRWRREPDPRRRHPGPRTRSSRIASWTRERPHAQPEPRVLQDRRAPGNSRDRRDPHLPLARQPQPNAAASASRPRCPRRRPSRTPSQTRTGARARAAHHSRTDVLAACRRRPAQERSPGMNRSKWFSPHVPSGATDHAGRAG